MRSSTARAGRGKSVHEEDRGPHLFRVLGWGPRDVAGFAIGAFATIAILSNVLFMQSGSHPAPRAGACLGNRPFTILPEYAGGKAAK